MSITLTQPIGGVPGVTVQPPTLIPVSDTVPVGNVSCQLNKSVWWDVAITEDTSGKQLVQRICAIRSSSGASHTRHGLVGDLLPHTVDVTITAENCIQLAITNSGQHQYTINTTTRIV